MTAPAIDPTLSAALPQSKAWPFEEARRLIQRLDRIPGGEDKTVLFETGYGPSGLPHIGTFGEVARTTMVRHAFEVLTEGRRKTRLICFSDDMDGLRKVPTNVPNQEMLKQHLEKPLTVVPDPFGKFESFAHHNNAMLRNFLDRFSFEYEFFSATQCYRAGMFDATLLHMLAAYDKVMAIILPTLGPERQATYAPFLPVCPRTGKVLQVPMVARDVTAGTVTYIDPETKAKVETPVTGGRVKCQWKADWAMRWTGLGIDYEMAGKDLIDSVALSSKICKALGGAPPEGFNYELFLDQNGEKISKSRGNGLTIEEWLTYASPESLSLYMFQKPKTAKKLFFDVIPRAVDEYLQFITAYAAQEAKQKLDNPVWHIHAGTPPPAELPITFGLLLNLVSVSNAENKDVLWGFVRRYSPGATPEANPILDRLSDYAIRYFNDFVKPTKKYRVPDEVEVSALKALGHALAGLPSTADADTIQNKLLDAGRAVPRYQDLTKAGPSGGPGVKLDWFQAIYEVVLGQERGPRLGTFIALYGIPEMRSLIAKAISGELAQVQLAS